MGLSSRKGSFVVHGSAMFRLSSFQHLAMLRHKQIFSVSDTKYYTGLNHLSLLPQSNFRKCGYISIQIIHLLQVG